MSARWERSQRESGYSDSYFSRHEPMHLPPPPAPLDTSFTEERTKAKTDPVVKKLKQHQGKEIFVTNSALGRNVRATLNEILSSGSDVMISVTTSIQGRQAEHLLHLNETSFRF